MISVITPVYQGERFIESCIKVVMDQNCSDVEHIIVDGGSKDRTVDIAKKYAEKYPYIRWVSEEDKGQSDAMNKGIEMAKGEVLAILNVDDFYEPNVLNRILTIFEALPEPSLLVGNCNVWNSDNKLLYINKPARLKLSELLLGFTLNPHPVNPSAYFYHTSLHKKIGFYKVDEHYAMDIDFLFRAVQLANVRYIDETWGNYRLLDGTKTMNDIESGQNVYRLEQLFNIYRKKLPAFQSWVICLKSKLYKNRNWQRLKYFIVNPNELVPRIKGKLLKHSS